LGIYRLDWVDFQHWQLPAEYERALKRLLDAITQPGETLDELHARVFGALRPLDFSAEISRLTHDFTGRAWLEKDLQQWLEQEDGRVFFVTGDPGSGKSAMLARLIEKHPRVMAYHFCVASLAETQDSLRFVRSIAAQLATQLTAYRAALEAVDLENVTEPDAGSLLRRLVAEPLQAERPDRPVLIVVDGLDEAPEKNGRTIPQLLRERLDDLPPWVRLVLSSRKQPAVLDSFSRFLPREIDAASPENLHDIEQYIDMKLRKSPKMLLALGGETERAIQTIRGKSEGNFLYVMQVIAEIEAGRLDVRRPEAFPGGLVGVYQSFFERIFPTPEDYRSSCTLLEIIAAAREPLSAEQIATFAGCEVFAAEQDMEKLAAFFPLRGPLGAEKYHPYHKSILDWLSGLAGQSRRYRVDLHRAHRRIAARLLADYKQGVPDRSNDSFILTHLPSHLIAAAQWIELEDLLTDLQFLEAKAAAGMVAALADDLRESVKALPAERPMRHVLRVIEEVLDMDLGFISRHPGALFQCLWNRCWWYDCQEAASHFLPPSGGWPEEGPAWTRSRPKMHQLAMRWRKEREGRNPGLPWLRSHRPLPTQPGSGIVCVLRPQGVEGRKDSKIGSPLTNLDGIFLSADGRMLACTLNSSNNNGRVLVFDVDEARLLISIDARARCVSFSPDGKWLVAGSAFSDDYMRVWDVASGQAIVKLGRGAFPTVLFSPDGLHIAAANEQGLQVWKVDRSPKISARLLWQRANSRKFDWLSSATWTRIAFSPDGSRIAVDREIFESATGRLLISLGGPEEVRCACFSPKGERLALSYGDNTLQTWDTASGQRLATATVPSPAEHLRFSSDSSLLFSAGAEGEAVWAWSTDLATATPMAVVAPSWRRESLSFSSDGQRVAVAPRLTGGGETAQVYRLAETADRPGMLIAHSAGVLWTAFLEHGRQIVSMSDRDVQLWNTATGELEANYPLTRHVTQASYLLSEENRFLEYRTGTPDEELAAFSWAMGQGVPWEDLQRNYVEAKFIRINLNTGQESESRYPTPLIAKPASTGSAPEPPRWYAQCAGPETIIRAADTGREVAWFPAALDELTPHPSGRTWAGSEGNDLYVLTLEGCSAVNHRNDGSGGN
jgi:WD40 repeat protein